MVRDVFCETIVKSCSCGFDGVKVKLDGGLRGVGRVDGINSVAARREGGVGRKVKGEVSEYLKSVPAFFFFYACVCSVALGLQQYL